MLQNCHAATVHESDTSVSHLNLRCVCQSALSSVVYVFKSASARPSKGGPIEKKVTFFTAGGAQSFFVKVLYQSYVSKYKALFASPHSH